MMQAEQERAERPDAAERKRDELRKSEPDGEQHDHQ